MVEPSEPGVLLDLPTGSFFSYVNSSFYRIRREDLRALLSMDPFFSYAICYSVNLSSKTEKETSHWPISHLPNVTANQKQKIWFQEQEKGSGLSAKDQ